MEPQPPSPTTAGVVLIGRNEGERILRAVDALPVPPPPVVYVDSGSTDGSPDAVAARGVAVHRLDPARPFSAARARNEGLASLRERHPDLAWVQFVDGDCTLRAGWLEAGLATLAAHPDVGVVAGLLVERDVERSPFARAMALEWELPGLGDVESVGGIFLARVAALDAVGGFDARLIAGEEFDLGLRLRRAGWRVVRIDRPMAVHDGGMTRAAQWWRRATRSGHTHAEAWLRYGRETGANGWRTILSSQFWGLVVPLGALVLGALTAGWGLLLLALWPLQMARIARYVRGLGFSARDAWTFSILCVLGMTPQALGQLRCLALALLRRRSTLIEYK